MRVPDGLSFTKIRTYGSGGIELDPGVAEPGCPDLYHAKYVATKRVHELDSAPRVYGSVIHRALYLMEEDGVGLDEALTAAWDARLDVDRWEEAERDLRRVVERGGLLGGLSTVAVEQELVTDLDEHGRKYRGIIDQIEVDADVTEDRVPTLYFVDWKTDRGTPSRKMVEEWKQGRGYAMLLYDHFQRYVPWAEDVRIVGIYDAIKRYPIAVEYSKEQIESFRSWAAAVYRVIEADTDHEPVLNPGCSWCPIRADCKVWNDLPGKADGIVARLAKKSLRTRAESLAVAKDTKSKLEALIRDTELALRDQVETAGPFKVSGGQWVLRQGERREVDWLAVAEKMGFGEYARRASMTLGDLDKWVEDHPEVNLEHLIRKVPGARQLKFEEDE